MIPEIKPCPFCGGKAELQTPEYNRSEEGMSIMEVVCTKCGVSVAGKSFNFWVTEYDPENPQDSISAVNRWNKRGGKT